MRLKVLLSSAAAGGALLAGPALAAPGQAVGQVSEVVVTAAPFPVSIDSATTHVDILTRETLSRLPPGGLGDVLNGLPGVRSSSFGPGASRPIIRGLSGPRVMILENGVGLVDASSLSPDHAVATDPGEASRIEVLRGPSTLAYGGSGIGGVVNILDDRVPSSAAKNGAEAHMSASAGTVDKGYSASASVKANAGPLVFAVDAVNRKSSDYKVPTNPVSDRLAAQDGLIPAPDRKVLNSDVELGAVGAGVSYVGAKGYLGVSVKRTTTNYGIPFAQVIKTGPPDPNAEGPVYIDLKQTRWDLRGQRQVALGPFDLVKLSVGYADYQHAEIGVDTGEVGTRFLSKGTEGRLELAQRQRGGWQGAVGVQGLSRNFEAIGDEAFVPPVDIREVGAFTLQRLDKDSWGLEGGLRIDRRTLKTATDDRAFSNVSGSVGAFLRPAASTFVGLSLSSNGRAPTEFELFADGPHGGTNSFEIGDRSLKSERVNSVEFTARYTPTDLKLEGHLYAARYNGYIEESPTGAVQDGLPVYQYAQTDATFWGTELEASKAVLHAGEGALWLEATYDWVRAKTDLGKPARIPPSALTGAIAWRAPRFDAQLQVRRVAKQDRVAPFELPTDGYTLVNLTASVRPFADQSVRLFADGRNLGDAEIREHTSFLKDIAPQPGRSFRIGAALDF